MNLLLLLPPPQSPGIIGVPVWVMLFLFLSIFYSSRRVGYFFYSAVTGLNKCWLKKVVLGAMDLNGKLFERFCWKNPFYQARICKMYY